MLPSLGLAGASGRASNITALSPSRQLKQIFSGLGQKTTKGWPTVVYLLTRGTRGDPYAIYYYTLCPCSVSSLEFLSPLDGLFCSAKTSREGHNLQAGICWFWRELLCRQRCCLLSLAITWSMTVSDVFDNPQNQRRNEFRVDHSRRTVALGTKEPSMRALETVGK